MRAEFADVLERFASDVMALQGVSRTNPHRFAEDKDELAKVMVAKARAYRAPPPRVAAIVTSLAVIRPGTRRVAGREVRVELRRSRG